MRKTEPRHSPGFEQGCSLLPLCWPFPPMKRCSSLLPKPGAPGHCILFSFIFLIKYRIKFILAHYTLLLPGCDLGRDMSLLNNINFASRSLTVKGKALTWLVSLLWRISVGGVPEVWRENTWADGGEVMWVDGEGRLWEVMGWYMRWWEGGYVR